MKENMFVVYWMENGTPSMKKFDSDEMTETLAFMAFLRKEEGVSFVTMCSENPNSVGKPGVDEVGPDYNWTKRRGNMPKAK